MRSKISFIKPSFPKPEHVAKDYEEIVNNNWFTNFGPFEQRFRKEAAAFIGEGVSACTVTSATLGLEIAVRALVKRHEGMNEVLVPSFTFAAGPEVLLSQGFCPVFIDINDRIQPDYEQAKAYLREKRATVSGILLCNTFGTGNEDISLWENLASEYSLPLIIDSAAGFGSEYSDSERVGMRGDCEVFSFHATKPFAVGEGGLITSRDEKLIQKCREIENFGFGAEREIGYIGTNAKMQEINAAIGLRQLQGFEDRLNARRESLRRYKGILGPLGYVFQPNDERSTVAFVSAIAKDSKTASDALTKLREYDVEARNYYQPLHMQRQFAHSVKWAGTLDKTTEIASRIISLPLHDHMKLESIEAITAMIRV